MILFIAGLLLIPTLFVIGLLAAASTMPPSFSERGCVVCAWKQVRADHPRRPGWLWWLQMKLGHDWFEDDVHREQRLAWVERYYRSRR